MLPSGAARARETHLSSCGVVVPSIKWSQWMVDGTRVSGSPEEMNCSTAICAVASCIATRSATQDRSWLSTQLLRRAHIVHDWTCHQRTWAQLQVALPPHNLLVVWVIEVPVDHLLCEVHRPVEALPDHLHHARHSYAVNTTDAPWPAAPRFSVQVQWLGRGANETKRG